MENYDINKKITKKLNDGQIVIYFWFKALHTRIDIVLKGNDESYLNSIADKIHHLVNVIEKEGNCFDEESLVYKFNHLPKGETMPGGEYLYEMLDLCKQYAIVTGGMFDVTVESSDHSIATINEITHLQDGKLSKRSENIKVNLSGFIKGYILDKIKALLKEENITDSIVNLGNSSILSMGNTPLKIKDKCITTSGNLGNSLHQVIDPRTNKPVMGKRIVKVITDGGAEGEVLATSFIVAGEKTPDEAYLISRFPETLQQSM